MWSTGASRSGNANTFGFYIREGVVLLTSIVVINPNLVVVISTINMIDEWLKLLIPILYTCTYHITVTSGRDPIKRLMCVRMAFTLKRWGYVGGCMATKLGSSIGIIINQSNSNKAERFT